MPLVDTGRRNNKMRMIEKIAAVHSYHKGKGKKKSAIYKMSKGSYKKKMKMDKGGMVY